MESYPPCKLAFLSVPTSRIRNFCWHMIAAEFMQDGMYFHGAMPLLAGLWESLSREIGPFMASKLVCAENCAF